MRFARPSLLVVLVCFLAFGALSGCGGDNDDKTAPNLTMDPLFSQDQNPSGTNILYVVDGNLSLAGTVEAGASMEIQINSDDSKEITPVGESWSYLILNDDLKEGTNSVQVTAQDDAENQTSIVFNVTKDTTGPDVTLDQYVTPEPTGTQTLAGTVEAGSTVSLSVDDGPEEPAPVSGGGWSFELNALAPGMHSVVATGRDALGNESPEPAAVILEVDPAAMVLTIDPVPATTEDTVFLSGTRSPGAQLTFDPIDTGGDISDVDLSVPDSWSATFSDLDSGFNLLSITIGADPPDVEARILVNRDRTGPVVTANSPAHGATVAVDAPITVAFDEALDEGVLLDPENQTITMVDSTDADIAGTIAYDSATRTATFTPDTGLTAGETYTVTVHADIEDVLGNRRGANYSWTFFTAGP